MSLSAHMNDWRQKIFDELDYLEETLRNKQRLLEREESVRELFQTFHIYLHWEEQGSI